MPQRNVLTSGWVFSEFQFGKDIDQSCHILRTEKLMQKNQEASCINQKNLMFV